ncbi:MAG: transglutaminase family protein [Propionicimonas sp.]|uniref:transglutaminase-like domain-containing protein n=1 Tax=Propionicimonas sp. TaxID=1955623 RepID=UPI003D108692
MLTLLQQEDSLEAYLQRTEVIDLDDPSVRHAHAGIVEGAVDREEVTRRVFFFVRDQIRHSADAGDHVVTLRASEVLSAATGLCYAKSHLAAALLRLSGIPTGLCFQLLQNNDRLVLHGLIAVHLDGAWHRLDVRGDRPGLHARFSLGDEALPFRCDASLGEQDLPQLLADAAPAVVRCLTNTHDILTANLPDSIR